MEQAGPTRDGRQTGSLFGTALLALAGPIIWAMHLLVVYGTHAVMCSQGASGPNAEIVVGAATLTALVALAIVAGRSKAAGVFGREGHIRSFLRSAMVLLIVLSAFGIAWAGSTMFFLPACMALR
jgi:hypothetical protein